MNDEHPAAGSAGREGCSRGVGRSPTLRLLLAVSLLLLTNGCGSCGTEEEKAHGPIPGKEAKPEKPVIVHNKLPDGGRGSARLVDLAEHKSPFEADPDAGAPAP